MLAKIKKVYQYGIRASSLIVKRRISLWCFASRWRKKIPYYQSPAVQSEPRFLTFAPSLCTAEDHQSCIAQAQKIQAGSIAVLGSHEELYTNFPWHTDIRLMQQNLAADVQFSSVQFFKDITIVSGKADYAKDIKVPWELARFQWAPLLGHAYLLTGQEMYAAVICQHIHDWINANPFLRGIHWVNPMEAGLRAINWLIALSMIKESEHADESFLATIKTSLYEHYLFIAGNFEWYDGKTSNHYLSDLVGYLYLSWFFGDMQNLRWAIDELEREMRKQILPDGMSYEGSTRYHRLVTELFYHVYLLCAQEGLPLSEMYKTTLQRMQEALWWCTPSGGELIVIGDDDSGVVTVFGMACDLAGKEWILSLDRHAYARDDDREIILDAKSFVHYSHKISVFRSDSINSKISSPLDVASRSSLRAKARQSSGKKNTLEMPFHYLKEFGLSIYKTQKAHVTLRHHAYNRRQPSGHFHNDVSSITLSINGIPIIVDPGSYLYTASRAWRNQLRSVAVHNSSYPVGVEPVPLTESLFFLDMQERINTDDIFCVRQEQYRQYGQLFERNVTCSDASIILHDAWQVSTEKQYTFCWNFTLHPAIVPRIENNQVQLVYDGKLLAKMQSATLNFCVEEGHYAPSYGVVQKTLCVRAYLPSSSNQTTITISYS